MALLAQVEIDRQENLVDNKHGLHGYDEKLEAMFRVGADGGEEPHKPNDLRSS